ncbi:MAG: pilus assembly protein [Clostridium sp.]|jgi:uncharacterized protein (UPF0333 family)|nr:pilus assembly protein [Clostridium sp.]
MKDDKGEMIIEASIVFPLVLIIYGILMFLVLLMYQKITLTTVANNTVSCVSANYGFSDKDPFMSFINKEQLNNRSVLYREIFGTTDKLDLPIERQAEWFGYYLLSKNCLLKKDGVKIKAKVDIKQGKTMQKDLIVTMTESYHIPLVSMLGINDKVEFRVTACAECVDPISYINAVDFLWEQVEKITETPEIKLVRQMIDYIKK